MARDTLSIENAKIGFRNFTGKEGKFNPAGRRNFCLFVEKKLGEVLEKDGWAIRWLEPNDDSDDRQPLLHVAVSYKNFPPKLCVITSRGKTILEEDRIHILDWAEIKNVDIMINPYNWNVSGKTGKKAYLKALYVTIVEDKFENKYRDVPDSAMNTMIGDDD